MTIEDDNPHDYYLNFAYNLTGCRHHAEIVRMLRVNPGNVVVQFRVGLISVVPGLVAVE